MVSGPVESKLTRIRRHLQDPGDDFSASVDPSALGTPENGRRIYRSGFKPLSL